MTLPDRYDLAVDHLLNQFTNSDLFLEFLRAVFNRIKDTDDILCYIKDNFNLDNATGVWLDLLGVIVGIDQRPQQFLHPSIAFTYRNLIDDPDPRKGYSELGTLSGGYYDDYNGVPALSRAATFHEPFDNGQLIEANGTLHGDITLGPGYADIGASTADYVDYNGNPNIPVGTGAFTFFIKASNSTEGGFGSRVFGQLGGASGPSMSTTSGKLTLGYPDVDPTTLYVSDVDAESTDTYMLGLRFDGTDSTSAFIDGVEVGRIDGYAASVTTAALHLGVNVNLNSHMEYRCGGCWIFNSALPDLDIANFTHYQTQRLNDADFRALIRAKAIANISRGTIPEIYTFIKDGLDLDVSVSTPDTGRVIIDLNTSVTNGVKRLIEQFAPVISGVRAEVVS